MLAQLDDAVEVLRGDTPSAPFLITAEHASERFPDPWRLPPEDAWLVGTHWAYDLGAADLARELARAIGATAVLSRFSRLLVDPNRDEASPGLFLARAEGREVALNRGIDADERELRLERLWRPYHAAIERELGRDRAPVVLAMHTFTPVFDGVTRAVEVGVLFDRDEQLAESARIELAKTGLVVRMNEPYSGRAGLIFSAEWHAQEHGRRALELEVRQDLAASPEVRAQVVRAMVALGRTLG
ncbi:MAG: N-formylglutamate amidohydrolase [Myxococcales bacterium]|nr:N-formylglutamate amidohydrolase [Myxococcales bacterium]